MLKIDCIRPNGDIYVVGDVDIEPQGIAHKCMLQDEESLVFVEYTNIEGIFKYGVKQLYNSRDHGYGYIWHSRASVMNKYFGCAMIDIYYRKEGTLPYYTCAIDLAHLEPLLEDTEYCIDWVPCESSEVDITYRIIKENK